MTRVNDHLDEIAEIVGADALFTGNDVSRFDPGTNPQNLDAGIVVCPGTLVQLAKLVTLCGEKKISLVAHGGRSGFAGGTISRAGQLIVSLEKLEYGIEIDPLSQTVVVGAGVTLEVLAEATRKVGLVPGIDIGSRGSATLGGLVATNAGGNEAFRNGVMRHQVLGLEAVMGDGSIFTDLKKVIKANEGLDVKQLLIGSEGILGIVTRVVLKLLPLQAVTSTALLGFDSTEQAVRALSKMNSLIRTRVLSAEAMWQDYFHEVASELDLSAISKAMDCAVYLLVETTADPDDDEAEEQFQLVLCELLENDLASDVIIAKNDSERADFWHIREDTTTLARRFAHALWFDVCIPPRHLDGYISQIKQQVAEIEPQCIVFLKGHLGDGNLHVTLASNTSLADSSGALGRVIYADLDKLGGAFSAEHGIGEDKKQMLKQKADPQKYQMMKAIKQLLDPHNIMNPGKVIMFDPPQKTETADDT